MTARPRLYGFAGHGASNFTPPLGEGIRASSTNVGYFPQYGALTEYTPAGAAPTGWAWDTNALITTTDNAVLNLAFINGGVVFAGHQNPTVTKCLVQMPAGQSAGITLNGQTKGTFTVHDTTFIGTLEGSTFAQNGISSDDILDCRRCHITYSGDGVHAVGNGSLISQVYVGPLRFLDEEQHCDGIQIFQDNTTNGAITIEHSYVYSSHSPLETPFSAAATMGPATAGGVTITPLINNNWFGGALGSLRCNFETKNCVITNNDFGPLPPGPWSYFSWEPPNTTIATWSNNRDENGDTIPPP